MSIGVDFVTLVDARAVGGEVVRSDFFTIPSPPMAGQHTYRTAEVPLNVVTLPSLTDPIYIRVVHPITHVPLGPVFVMVTHPTVPLPGEFQIHTTNTFAVGTIVFSLLDGGLTVEIIYTGRGSLVFASDVNDPRDEIKDSRSTESDLGARLDLIEDGTRILPGAIRPSHISTVATDDFTFPRHVTVTGDLNIVGNVNKSITEVLTSSDEVLTLNADHTAAPTADCGLEIERGSSPNVNLLWKEADDKWQLFGGNLDLSQNQLVASAFEYVASPAAETTLAGSAVDGQLIYRTDIKGPRYFNSGLGVFVGIGISVTRNDYEVGTPSGTYTGSTTVFDLPFMYNVGSGQLMVFAGGLLQKIGATEDYLETDNDTITFNNAQEVGRNIALVNLGVPV
jgi:hypothetical protein